ncbi:hypothetical protein BGX29_003709 [Mortierella sp. GBA35]|nr:hypothetical protein BGX29_003709 [Mortierella sp. GBA35]
MNNDKGEIMVTWSDDDDDDLFREEEEAEKDERTGPLYQGKAAALAKEDVSLLATSPVRWRKSVAVIPAAKNVPQDVSQDLRTEIVQLSTSTATISSSSNSNNKNHSRFQPSSGTNTDAPDHIEWGDDLRNDIARLETSKPALAAGDDLRNAINSMTRKMKDLESPETRAGGAFASTRASSSRPLESGITLVTVRNTPGQSIRRPSASDVIAAQPKRDSYRPSNHRKVSRKFCGIAKMVSEISWFGERTIFDRSRFRQKFKLQWIGCSRVPYDRITILTHTPVHSIIRRHGEELSLPIGDAIHKLLVEYLPEDQRQPTAASTVPAGITVADATATSLSQDVSMDESKQDQGDQPLHLNSLPIDDSHMDADMPEPARIVFRDKEDNASDDDRYFEERKSKEGSKEVTLCRWRRRPVRRAGFFKNQTGTTSRQQRAVIGAIYDAIGEGRSCSRGHLVVARTVSVPFAARTRTVSVPFAARTRTVWWKVEVVTTSTALVAFTEPITSTTPSPVTSTLTKAIATSSKEPIASAVTTKIASTATQQQQQQQQYGSSRSRSSPASSQRSKDPRNRSSSVHVFHSGIPAADPRLADYGSKRHALPPRPGQTIPQKRPHDEDGDGKMEEMDGDDVEASTASLMPSVFPLEDDDDDHFMAPAHSSAPSGSGSGSGAGPSFSAAGPSTTAPAPQIITSVTLVPAGLSKRQKKKLRKEALSKPLNF